MTETVHTLAHFGWTQFFAKQVIPRELPRVFRVLTTDRTLLTLGGSSTRSIPFPRAADNDATIPTVGDWILLDTELSTYLRVLERYSLFYRRSPRLVSQKQLVAANVDRLLIMTSCNHEFNESRLERYIVMANESGAEPVILLTKTDLTTSSEAYIRRAQQVACGIPIHAVNTLDKTTLQPLLPKSKTNLTYACVGSSGVGKSALINTLLGIDKQKTHAIRLEDSKGRHTTTRRSLLQIPDFGVFIDVPGIREIGVMGSKRAVRRTFPDIIKFETDCKFRNCTHGQEPECAVRKHLEHNRFDHRRLDNYRKLLEEVA